MHCRVNTWGILDLTGEMSSEKASSHTSPVLYFLLIISIEYCGKTKCKLKNIVNRTSKTRK